MNKRVKLCLALFLAFAVIVQYSFSPQVMIAYGEDGDTVTATEASDQAKEEPKAEPAPAPEPTKATEAPAPASEPAAPAESSDSDDSPAAAEDTDADVAVDNTDVDSEDPLAVNEEEEEEGYPAQDFSESANGVSVKVSAPKGALPEGTKMSVSGISDAQVQAAVEGVVDGEVANLKAVDITFKCDGKEIEPKKAVSVHMTASGVEADKVVHIADNGNANVVSASTSGSSASFKSDEFSVYIVVEENPDDPDINAIATYEFVVNGTVKNTQRVKHGDELVDPGSLGAADGARTTFKGWVVSEGQTIQGETVGSDLAFGEKDVPVEETIKVEPKLETTYYVTFFGEPGTDGEPGIVEVEAVTVDGEFGVKEGNLKISDKSITPKADTSAFEGWTYDKGGSDVIADETISFKDDTQLYAVVVKANWIHFYENVGDNPDSDATYTGPVYVKKTDDLSKKKPNDPTRRGYTFEGWYKDADCTEAFEWEGTGLEKDIDLYAKWEPATVEYTIIIWKQKVTDDKKAAPADRKYDFESSEQKTGKTGSTLSEEQFDSYTEFDYTGFHFGRIEIKPDSKEIQANGSTVVNVYYDRDLMTILFYDGETEIVYEPTQSTGNQQQYGLIDGEYVALTRHGGQGNRYWTYPAPHEYTNTVYSQASGTGGTQYGFSNGQMVQITHHSGAWGGYWTLPNGNVYYGTRYVEGAAGNSGYGVVGGQVVGISHNDEGWYYTTDERYSGQRYVATEEEVPTPYTGLYGSTLESNGYSWPSDRAWYNTRTGQATRLTFLDAFKFEGLSGVDAEGTTLTQFGRNLEGSSPIRFFKQNIDGTWPGLDSPTNTVYTTGGTFTITEKYEGFKAVAYSHGTGGRTTAHAGDSTSGQNLNVWFERQKFSLTFKDGDKDIETVSGIPYEDSISKHKIADPTKDHYKFAGWYEDTAGTAEFDWSSKMPAANKVLYAKWTPMQYHVSLDPDGGEFKNAQVGEFNVTYGVDNGPLNKDSLFKNVEKTDYELIGWFYKNSDGSAGNVYDYGMIESDVNLIAKWRYPGQVSIVYDAGEGGKEPPEDNYKYSTDSSVVLAAPPKTINPGYTFVGWKLKKDETEKIYYVNNAFDITTGLIENYDPKTQTGVINVEAVYLHEGDGPLMKTHIAWYRNDGTPAFHKDTYESDPSTSTLGVNQAVSIQNVDPMDGYDFLGWARVTEEKDAEGHPIEPAYTQNLGEKDLFIKYVDGKFYSAKTGKEATRVAGDEEREYQAMFAVWCPKKYTVKYTDGVDGTVFADETHPNLTAKDTTPKFNNGTDPTRDGYDFDGWNPAYTTKLAIDKADSNNVITYTAKWKEKTVTINYVSADETMGSVTSPSETVTLTGDAEGSVATPAEGFEFVSWTKNGVVVSTEASFIPKKVDGKNVAATYVANFKKATEPDRLSIEISTAQKNATYNGSKQENGYTLIYKINGNVVSKGDFPSEATVTEPDKRVAAGTNVGNYEQPVKVTLSAPEESGYIIDTPEVTATVKLNITPATLTITAENKSKIYGEADPELTAKVEGLCGSDTVKYDLTRDAGEAVGKYTIRVSLVEAASVEAGSMELHANAALDPANYNIKLVNGTLTITAPTPDDVTPTPTPTPGGGNAITTVLPAAAPIVDTPVPTTIDEPAPPKAVNAYWALINLLCAIATALLSLIMLIRYFGKRKDEEDVLDPATGERVIRDVEEQRGGLARIASLVPAIGGIIAFLLTEDMSLPMAMVDKWTVLMIVILAIQAGVGIVAKLRDEKDDEDEEAMA